MSWLYIAFIIVWIIFILYVARLWMVRNSLKRELLLLEEAD